MACYFIAETDHDALSYSCGEPMVFSFRLTDGDQVVPCSHFNWVLETEDGINRRGCCTGKDGTGTVVTSLKKPGFVHLTVTAVGEDGQPLPDAAVLQAGAGAEIQTLRPVLPEPEDFDVFWKRTIALLDTVEPRTLQMIPLKNTNPDCDYYDVRVCAGEPALFGGNEHNRYGYPASGYLSIPRAAKDGKTYPLMLQFQGWSFVGATPVPFKDRITFQVNPHGLPNGLPPEQYAKWQKSVGAFGFFDEDNTDPDTVYFKGMILRNIQALRWAKTLSGWDGKSIIISGGSMGAFQSVSLAALCPEITSLELSIPWLCDVGGALYNRLPGWRPEIQMNGALQKGLLYYDTTSFGARVSCPLTIDAGLGDYVCPPSGVTSLYNCFPSAHKSLRFWQNWTHGYRPPQTSSYTIQNY